MFTSCSIYSFLAHLWTMRAHLDIDLLQVTNSYLFTYIVRRFNHSLCVMFCEWDQSLHNQKTHMVLLRRTKRFTSFFIKHARLWFNFLLITSFPLYSLTFYIYMYIYGFYQTWIHFLSNKGRYYHYQSICKRLCWVRSKLRSIPDDGDTSSLPLNKSILVMEIRKSSYQYCHGH